MTVSLVIPAYRERGRIGATLAHVVEYLSAQPYDWEVLVVIDDGDDDETAAEARAAAGGSPQVRVLVNDANRGKGFSVRRGFAEAHGDLKVFIDAALSLPVEGLAAMCERFAAGADVVIASRSVPGAREIGAPPPLRRVMSRVFNWLVQVLAVRGLRDTQCGFKGFTAAAASTIFARQRSDRFGFDVEALFLARRHGYRIDEIPVTCVYRAESSVNRLGDAFSMLRDVLTVRWRHRQ